MKLKGWHIGSTALAVGFGLLLVAGCNRDVTGSEPEASESAPGNVNDVSSPEPEVSEDTELADEDSPPEPWPTGACCYAVCKGQHHWHNLGDVGWGNCNPAATHYCKNRGKQLKHKRWAACP